MPRYQRAFAWTKIQLEDLHNDLSKQDNTFIGAFVLLKNEEVLEIIDGQQRFTTLTILFCVLRDLARKYEFLDISQRINENEIQSEDGTTGEFKYILRSGFLTASFLKNYIFKEQFDKEDIPQDQLKFDHNKRILECYNFFETIDEELKILDTSIEKKKKLNPIELR